jgi:hypothetical protein
MLTPYAVRKDGENALSRRNGSGGPVPATSERKDDEVHF